MSIVIPRGKKIIISVDGSDIMKDGNIANGLSLTIDQEVSLGLSSSFSELFESKGSALLDVAGSVARDITRGRVAFSSQMKAFGFQYWRKSDPINVTFNLNFYMGKANAYDALREVVNPMMKLASLCLPSEGGTGGFLVAPGPSLLSLIDERFNDSVRAKKINIIIGGITRLYNVIVKRAEPTFSKEVDTRGYPISGTINLEISTVFNATSNMLNVPKTELDFTQFS